MSNDCDISFKHGFHSDHLSLTLNHMVKYGPVSNTYMTMIATMKPLLG